MQTDELRANLHRMWDAVAPAWAERADYVDQRSHALTRAMLDAAALRPGDRVLELACGPGGLGLAAAPLVAPDGEVVVSDVAAEMVAIAARRAEGLPNVTTRVLDLEAIDEPDDAYDAVLCREGLMLVPDPARAVAEIDRVLRPGGRFAIAFWGPRERNPWLGALFDAVTAELGQPVPPPGLPGPFSLGERERVDALFPGATIREVAVSMPVRDVDDWWSHVTGLAGPLAALLASLPDEPREAIRARAREALSVYETESGLEIPGVSWLVTS